ncbi:hypothetical protein N9P05_02580, partial [Flavobacteriaceae bacterium]|nr:hypothetical protein [Flavobacteriaceae bacterium]
MLNIFKNIKSNLLLDKNEKVFLNKNPKIILVQVVPSYYEFNMINQSLKKYGTENGLLIIG